MVSTSDPTPLRVCRAAQDSDFESIWPIIHEVVRGGDTYAFDPDLSCEAARQIWMIDPVKSYVCAQDDRVVGTFLVKPNQAGPGSHVANAAFMVHPEFRGQGIGRSMGEYALMEARRLGYRAMQFNCVVSTNQAALSLWQKLGFTTVGTLPGAFNHRRLGYVDAHVMYRWLESRSS